MTTDPFGNLFAAPQLEAALQTHLIAWLPAYVAEVERQMGIEARSIALPKFYGTSVEADMHPGEKFPAVIVVSPGTIDTPENVGGGVLAAWYQATVVVLVITPDETSVRTLAGMYAAAVRGAIMQHGALGGIADGVRWDGEEFQGSPGDQRNRTRGAALCHFRVRIANTMSTEDGPQAPPADPYIDPDDLPTVQVVEIDVTDDD